MEAFYQAILHRYLQLEAALAPVLDPIAEWGAPRLEALAPGLPRGQMDAINATWFASPAQYVRSAALIGLVRVVVFGLLILLLPARMRTAVEYAAPSSTARWRFDRWFLAPLATASLIGSVYFKWVIDQPLWFMLMPCHLCGIMAWLLCLAGPGSRIGRAVLPYILAFRGPVIIALLKPDLRGVASPLHFFVFHWFLALLPLFLEARGHIRLPTNPINIFARTLFDFGVLGGTYCTLGTVLSLAVGVNLNYVLSPPELLENVGSDYRYVGDVTMYIVSAAGYWLCFVEQVLINATRALTRRLARAKKD